MKRAKLLLGVLAVTLVLGAGIRPALAYFTATDAAAGSLTVSLPPTETELKEPRVENWTKHVQIECREGSAPVFVRARGFAGSEYTLSYSGTDWTDGGDGYWYYTPVVSAGETTAGLLVAIGDVPEGTEEDSFNVVVVYESVRVLYDENGDPYADWTLAYEGGND